MVTYKEQHLWLEKSIEIDSENVDISRNSGEAIEQVPIAFPEASGAAHYDNVVCLFCTYLTLCLPAYKEKGQDGLCIYPLTAASADELVQAVRVIEAGHFYLGTKTSALVGFHRALPDDGKHSGTLAERNQTFSARYQDVARETFMGQWHATVSHVL